ncbi:MAG: hypothetical protein NC347_00250 [Clostridium sp.]|nr:hypothetical protein [Clostridium sp.]
MSFEKRENFKYTALSSGNNLFYAAEFKDNNVEIFSGTEEALINQGFSKDQIDDNLNHLESSIISFLSNAKLRKMTAEQLYHKIRKKEEA